LNVVIVCRDILQASVVYYVHLPNVVMHDYIVLTVVTIAADSFTIDELSYW